MDTLKQAYNFIKKHDYYMAHSVLLNWPFRQTIINVLSFIAKSNAKITFSSGPH